jgi:hypothetical protein
MRRHFDQYHPSGRDCLLGSEPGDLFDKTGGKPMALFDHVLESGNVVTGLAIGTVALIGWPLVSLFLRPLAKAAVKGSIVGYREATRLYDSTVRGVGDLAREAIEELGSDLAKEAVVEVGTDLAKEAVS